MEFGISGELAARAARRFGSAGTAWADALPATLISFARRHDLRYVRQLPVGEDLAVGFLVQRPDQRLAMLRAAFDRAAVARQAAALDLWRDLPAVDLLGVDLDHCILLVDALDSDRSLLAVSWDRAVTIAVGLVRQLWIPAPAGVFSQVTWEELPAGDGGIDGALAADGHSAAGRRRSARETRVLLHGDLHRGNVLATHQGDQWVTVDPSPCVGPPAVDLAILASDLIGGFDNHSEAKQTLTELVHEMTAFSAGHSVEEAAILDWMLLHRLDRVALASHEQRDPAWDIELAHIIAAAAREQIRRTSH